MIIERKGWLTTKEVIRYVKETHKRHWDGKCYLYFLARKNKIKTIKIGHSNLYSQEDIDRCVSTLKRESTPGYSIISEKRKKPQ